MKKIAEAPIKGQDWLSGKGMAYLFASPAAKCRTCGVRPSMTPGTWCHGEPTIPSSPVYHMSAVYTAAGSPSIKCRATMKEIVFRVAERLTHDPETAFRVACELGIVP